jgi:hypothetical protein
MTDNFLPVVRPLKWKEALKSFHTIGSGMLPPNADWIIHQRGPDNCHWGAYKHVYMANTDDMQWVPLEGSFATVEEAQIAVKEFINSCQPVFLDQKGEVIRG